MKSKVNSSNWFPSRRKWRAVAVFMAAGVAAFFASAASIPVQSFHPDADGVTLTMSPGKMKLTVCSDGIVRVMYSPATTLPAGQDFVVTNHSWKKTSFKVADANGTVTVATRKLKVAVDKASGAVAFYDGSGRLLLAEPVAGGKTMTPATVNGESAFQPEQTFTSPADEFIYGLGQFQEGIWNWRGMPQELRQLNTEISIPMIVSSRGYGLLWNNAALTDFNPADTPVTLTIGKRSGEFPGMLKERSFRVVFVSPGHGTAAPVLRSTAEGGAAEENADSVVHYTGKTVVVKAKK
jgi:alpha-D-xyloside xylohydrolase